jgi:hypothetical protein
MPEDTTGFLVHRMLESHWPTVVVLAAAAAITGWLAFARDDRRLLVAGGAIAVLATGVALLGTLVVTDRESALQATRNFVLDAEEGRVNDLVAWLDPDATLHVGRVESPGYPRESLVSALEQLDGPHRVKDNTITLLDAAMDASGVLWVELACLTSTDSSYGTVPSRWIFEWMPPVDGRPWKVRSLTAVSVAGRTPGGRDIFR